MNHTERISDIRHQFREFIRQQGLSDELLVSERLLIRDGLYCGRRLEAGRFRAIWFAEEDQLKIYHESGGLLYSDQATETERRAA